MNSGIQEIQQHIQHEDYALALRRLLDISLYTNNKELITTSIEISRRYRDKCQNKKISPDERTSLLEELNSLLPRLHDAIPESTAEDGEILNAQGVSKKYKKGHFELQAMDINIRQGQVIGIVGENGNGKTTLLRALGGQLELSSGSINYPLFPKADLYDIRSKIAFIPQRIPRWYGYLKDNLHFSAAIAEVYEGENELMIEYILERLGLNNYRNLTWDQISSGYRTRFEIARILLQRPSLLILDEPLANLDINTQEIILNDLRFMAKSAVQPFGIILSSQQLHEVEKVADQIIVLRQGRHIHSQDTSELIASEDTQFIVEIETKNSREEIGAAFNHGDVEINYNGGFFQLQSTNLSAQQMIKKVIESDIQITYYRDITFSSKRFF